MTLAATALAGPLAIGCETYLAPPQIAGLNDEAGVFDAERGPLAVRFSAPIDLTTLNVSLFVDRRSREGDLCTAEIAGASAPGCLEEATRVLGACTPGSAPSARTEDGRVRFTCAMGGAIIAAASQDALELSLEGKLIPFERYTLRVEPGLVGADGADTGAALEARFSVKSDLPLGPTDLMPGMWFSIVDIFEPIPAQFQFWFWFAVKADTGEIRLYAADADPKDMATDPKINRDPRLWTGDPNPPTGVSLTAAGQVADQDGQRLVRIFPFTLKVLVPPVEALSTEISARIRVGEYPGAPAGDREILEGTMRSPAVFLGLDSDRAALGAGRGAISMFRLREDEVPPFPAILATGVTEEQVKNPFGP